MKHLLLLLLSLSAVSWAAEPWRVASTQIDAVYPQVEGLYLDLHRNPELSYHEEKTAAKIAGQLRQLGYDVTTGVGGNGVVGVFKNGAGPVVMLRAELDALPVPEKTGLAYASHVTTHDDRGVEVPVMHACGHDLHMAIGIGTAALLVQNKDRWHGTFIYVGQPAEERIGGAKAMMKDGLFTRFPKPDFVFGVHDSSGLPAGKVGYTPGFSAANADSVNVTVYGVGGHGSAPQQTVDPIVIAARTIVSWQTIVSREIDPREPAVITVGSIHGGTKNNIIRDEVQMQLTVRSYEDEVRKHLLASIERSKERPLASVIFALYNNTIYFQMGYRAGIDAFTAAVLGGIGSLPGAVLGGLVIGLARAFSDQYLETQWTNVLVFAVLILVLVFRPSGLLGAKQKDKV